MTSIFRPALALGMAFVACSGEATSKDCDPSDETCNAPTDDSAALLQTLRSAPPNAQEEFEKFVEKYHKTYATKAEKTKAFKAYQENVQRIDAHNKGNHTDKWGVNQFSDMSEEDFGRKYYMTTPVKADPDTPGFVPPADGGKTAPLMYNWQKWLGPAENQDPCGSCWIFSAIGSLEGTWARSPVRKFQSMSKQQYIACMRPRNACNGGYPNQVIGWLISGKYQQYTTESWPYTGISEGPCDTNGRVEAFSPGWIKGQIKLYNNADGFNALQYMQLALMINPLYFCTSLSQAFKQYTSGTVDMCDPTSSSGHCMVFTGWNFVKESYWIVRNSWGTGWGDNGYVYAINTPDFQEKCFVKSVFGMVGFPTRTPQCEGKTAYNDAE